MGAFRSISMRVAWAEEWNWDSATVQDTVHINADIQKPHLPNGCFFKSIKKLVFHERAD